MRVVRFFKKKISHELDLVNTLRQQYGRREVQKMEDREEEEITRMKREKERDVQMD